MNQRRSCFWDIGAVGTISLSFLDAVPKIAALVGAIYYAVLIWETKTVRRWTNRLPPE